MPLSNFQRAVNRLSIEADVSHDVAHFVMAAITFGDMTAHFAGYVLNDLEERDVDAATDGVMAIITDSTNELVSAFMAVSGIARTKMAAVFAAAIKIMEEDGAATPR